MAEFDDKLNSLLSNPEAMDQIMKMAQSLMGNGGGTEQPPRRAALRRNRKRSAERRPSVSAERSRQQGDGTELGPAHPGKPNPVSQRACGERSAGVWPRFSLRTG